MSIVILASGGANPMLRRLGTAAPVRPSFVFDNTCDEIDRVGSVVRRLARD